MGCLVWEIVGLDSGSLPLTLRFVPPIGGALYWLRPGTVRLPPWPDKVPFSRGSRRTLVDVALYAGVVAVGAYLLLSDGEATAGTDAGRLDPVAIAVTLGLLALLGLRDKVPFLAARPEVYGFLLIVSLFPVESHVVGWQLVFVCIWWGAAASKLNRHFPYSTSVMIANAPLYPSRVKARLWKSYPDEVRPSRLATLAAYGGTAVEFSRPLVLLLSSGGTLATLALIGMVLLPVHITASFPAGVPLEWNVFMLFGLVFLFGQLRRRAAVGLRPAAPGRGRRHRGTHPDRRQPAAGQGLLPARHALLRRQLGDQPVAVWQGDQGGGEA